MDKIKYFQENGKLGFWYGLKAWLIPKKIVAKGEESIKRYTKERVRRYEEEESRRAANRRAQYIKTNFEISTTFEKKQLRGRIIYSKEKNILVVRLEKPIAMETLFTYGNGFASAMAGHRVFQESKILTLTDGAINDAKDELIDLYKNWKNRDAIALAERLNKS